MKVTHLALLFTLIFWFSCQKNTDHENNKSIESNNASVAALEQEVLALQDSILLYRDLAFALEEEKINSTAALIEEVENVVTGYEPTTIEALKKSLNKVQSLRYTIESLGNESVMLTYDEACDELLANLNELANETDNFSKYVRANLLIKDIIEANNQDLFIRKEHNFYAQEYNTKISENRNQLDNISKSKISIEKYPLFYGEPES